MLLNLKSNFSWKKLGRLEVFFCLPTTLLQVSWWMDVMYPKVPKSQIPCSKPRNPKPSHPCIAYLVALSCLAYPCVSPLASTIIIPSTSLLGIITKSPWYIAKAKETERWKRLVVHRLLKKLSCSAAQPFKARSPSPSHWPDSGRQRAHAALGRNRNPEPSIQEFLE